MKCKYEREIIIDDKKYYACMFAGDFAEWECSYSKGCYSDVWEEKDDLP